MARSVPGVRGRPRLRHVPDLKSVAAHAILEEAKWRRVSWCRGTKGRLVARYAAIQSGAEPVRVVARHEWRARSRSSRVESAPLAPPL